MLDRLNNLPPFLLVRKEIIDIGRSTTIGNGYFAHARGVVPLSRKSLRALFSIFISCELGSDLTLVIFKTFPEEAALGGAL